ncbi:hypothetical protein HanHA300_Chr02g0039971 [Helianthus annuus]|nr:hypothetical protein HanHA300_Chr02g0039971 [Helianthus annuus]
MRLQVYPAYSYKASVTIEHPAGPQPSQGDSTAVQTTQQANNLQGVFVSEACICCIFFYIYKTLKVIYHLQDGILSSTKQLSTGKSIGQDISLSMIDYISLYECLFIRDCKMSGFGNV